MRLEVAASERHRAALDHILASRIFADAPVLRKLLGYLAEKAFAGTAADLKEYTIGTELFGKQETYSPQTDPSVRVQASRLRSKLDEYYRGEGAEAEVLIKLPKGSFNLVFEDHATEEAPPPPPIAAAPAVPRRSLRSRLFVAAMCALSAVCIYEGMQIWRLRGELEKKTLDPVVANLWQPLLSSPRPLLLVLGTPMFIDLGNGFYRNSTINSQADLQNSPEVQALLQRLGVAPRRFFSSYTGIGEGVGAFRMGQLLFAAGKPVSVSRSSTLSWDEVGSHDLIVLGSTKSNPQMKEIPANTRYHLVPGGIKVTNPLPGEPSFYKGTRAANYEVLSDYVVVTRMPGLAGNGYIMMIGSESTPGNWAGTEYVTNPNYVRQLSAKLADPAGRLPQYFELLLHAEFKSERPVRVEYVHHQVLGK